MIKEDVMDYEEEYFDGCQDFMKNVSYESYMRNSMWLFEQEERLRRSARWTFGICIGLIIIVAWFV